MYRRQLIVRDNPKSSIAEAYRTFRTNIQHSKVDGPLKSIMFTSSAAGEGKSVVAANAAIAFAQGGAKVILLDCDLRRPVQHLIFGRVATGITNILVGDGTIADYLQETDTLNLKILTSGPIPPNPSELLNGKRMATLLSDLRKQADYLIIDTSPVLPVTDACVLASKVDGIVMVIGAGIARPEMAQRANEALKQVNGLVVGMMLNRVKTDDVLKDYSSYYGYYDEAKKTAN